MKLIKNLIANVVISGALLFVLSWMNWQLIWADWQPTNIGIKIDFTKIGERIDLPDMWNSTVSLILAFLILWLIFRVFNSPIKWILKTLACPINFLTLGLASIVINVLIFYLFQYFVNMYFWEGTVVLWAIWQTLILSFIMAISTAILTKIF